MNISRTTAAQLVALLDIAQRVVDDHAGGSLYYENKSRQMRLMIKKLNKKMQS